MAKVSIISFLILCTAGVAYAKFFAPNFCKRPDPWSLSKIRPELFVYAREPSVPVSAKLRNESEMTDFVKQLEEEGYLKPTRPIVFIVHGYMGYIDNVPWYEEWMKDMQEALLGLEDYVVFYVDWSRGADVFYDYGIAASNTQTVSAFLANFSLAILNSDTFNGNENLLYLYCIGHSLGAQVCGQAGRASRIFDRITGLDPAGPGFENCTDNIHVDVDCATCVDNIHTDGTKDGHWNPIVPHFGTLEAWGHIDFYPNGGGNQPGCINNDVPPCSHHRAISLFIDTLKEGSTACVAACNDNAKCGYSTQPLGYYSTCNRNQGQVFPGSFYLTTQKREKYC